MTLLLELEFVDKRIQPRWLDWRAKMLFKNIMPIGGGKAVLIGRDEDGNRYPLINLVNGEYKFGFSMDEELGFLLNQEYVVKKKPLTAGLPFHYHRIPFRIMINKMLVKLKKRRLKKVFPSWPRDASVDILVHIKGVINKSEPRSWAGNKKYAVMLSHDIDTYGGLKRINKLLEIEKEYVVRSTNFIVGNYYEIKKEILKEITKSGGEIGLHGDNHDALLPYLDENEINKRLEKCRGFINEYKIIGFRAPSLLMTRNLDNSIKKFFKYDSSITDTELFMPDSDYSGSCTVFPFFRDGILKIPITLPMDSSLIFLGYDADEILEIWIDKLEFIKKIGGIATIVVHSEKHFGASDKMLDAYRKFIEYLAKDKDVWIATGKDVYEYLKDKKNVTRIN
ncbi:MAG TPA: polysaccharide deacetylase family protein [Candidatus Nanoarchaeia archaeon]|nr:polysaccharide deacetylase family protein [Candidatus Nanoarchaeia archaeon]